MDTTVGMELNSYPLPLVGGYDGGGGSSVQIVIVSPGLVPFLEEVENGPGTVERGGIDGSRRYGQCVGSVTVVSYAPGKRPYVGFVNVLGQKPAQIDHDIEAASPGVEKSNGVIE